MFKDILIPMVADTLPESAITAACEVAKSYDAHVDALVGVSMILPNAAVWTYCPDGFCETLKQAAETAGAALTSRAEERLSRELVPHGVRQFSTLSLTIAEMTALCARYADVVVLARGRASQARERHLFAGLLADSGRPLLLVPEGHSDVTGHAVVAWNASREATRALHDALPLLRKASSVDLLFVEGPSRQDFDYPLEADRVLAHLARHDITATFVRRGHGDLPVGRCILEYATESGANLIVTGGYSHSHARERVFGGVTQTLFEHASCAVLFSH